MKNRKSTTIDLIVDLMPYNSDGKLNAIIDEARLGEFHDYKNQKYACGKLELHTLLAPFPELEHIRKAVADGDYDESPDAEDKAMMKADIIKDMGEKAAKLMIKELGLDD